MATPKNYHLKAHILTSHFPIMDSVLPTLSAPHAVKCVLLLPQALWVLLSVCSKRPPFFFFPLSLSLQPRIQYLSLISLLTHSLTVSTLIICYPRLSRHQTSSLSPLPLHPSLEIPRGRHTVANPCFCRVHSLPEPGSPLMDCDQGLLSFLMMSLQA